MSLEARSDAGWSVGAAAERVGVSVSTLRSWESRYGLGPRGRTSGGHRRYTATDVARLQRLHHLVQSGVPTGAAAMAVREGPSRDPGRANGASGNGAAAVERLRASIDAFDIAVAERIARRVLDERGTVAAWAQVFTPVLQALGQRWESSGAGIECEHLAAELIGAALADHRRRRRVRTAAPRGGALLAAAPLEGHSLPLHALATALAEHGIASTVLDSLPAVALRAAVEQVQPAAVVVFARSRDTADGRALRRLVARVPLLCAGGPGWPARLPAGVTHAPDLTAALDLLRAAIGQAAGTG
ncbi:MAG: MerR family transcriptional regulator [Jatrophihabitantaceae bacterium]